MSSQKKRTLTELPKLKRNKVLNTRDRANIMKIIPTRTRASLRNGSSRLHKPVKSCRAVW